MNPKMQTAQNLQSAADLIRDLLRAIVADEDAPEIDFDQTAEGVEFTVEPSASSVGPMVGREGCHVKAMKALVSQMGVTAGYGPNFSFHVLEPRPGVRTPRRARPTQTVAPEPFAQLLARTLTAIGVFPAEIRIGQLEDGARGWEFQIGVTQASCYRILTVPPPRGRDPQAAIGALGTLFRAAGKKVGVEVELEVFRAQ